MKRILIYTASLVLFGFTLPAFSVDFNFLNYSPVRYYTSQDWKMLNAASENALNNLSNGEKATWKNPASGNWGFVQPLNKVRKNGTICRDLKIFNHANHREDQYVFMFCKYSSGWKVPSEGG